MQWVNGPRTPPQDIVLGHRGRSYRARQTSSQPLRSLDALLEEMDECVKFIETPPRAADRCISLSPLSIRTATASVSSGHRTPEEDELVNVVEGIRRGYRKTLWVDDGRRLHNTHPNLNNRLPGEVMMNIFSFLTVPDLAMAATTCRVWFVRMDPWVYLEHHGWVPLAPLSRCLHVHIRPSSSDGSHLPSVFATCGSCLSMSLELNGHSALLPGVATDPVQHTDLVNSWAAMVSLRKLHIQRPTMEDMALLGTLLAALPKADVIEISDLTMPMGVRVLHNVSNTTASVLSLHKVSHILGPSLWRLFKVNRNLDVISLHKCVLGSGNGNKVKVSCSLHRDGTIQRPVVHSVKPAGTHSTFIEVSRSNPACVCVPCVFQCCALHSLRPVAMPCHPPPTWPNTIHHTAPLGFTPTLPPAPHLPPMSHMYPSPPSTSH